MNNDWMKDLKAEDLPGDLRAIAQECGVDVAIRLLKMGGTQVYIPKLSTVITGAKRRYIHANRGRGVRELARATGFCERQVQRILADICRSSGV